jgi:hypothetical protein
MVERWYLDNGREGKKKYRIMKRKLSSNGQQFHQYQSPLTEHKKKREHILMMEMHVMAWDRINGYGQKKMHCNRVHQ